MKFAKLPKVRWKLLVSLIAFGLLACSESTETSLTVDEASTSQEHRADFQSLIDSTGFVGSILVYSPTSDTYYSNDFERSEQGFLPASTFKIPNSIIGLESGVVSDTSIFRWDGQEQWLRSWEQDFDLAGAYKASCVWCYQELARRVGTAEMRRQLNKMAYTEMVFDSTNIDSFWLTGDSRISQMQQINFLQGVQQEELDLSQQTYKHMREIMLFEESEGHSIRAKTGMTGFEEGTAIGWFVGYIERADSLAFFATNIETTNQEQQAEFIRARIDLSKQALSTLAWLD